MMKARKPLGPRSWIVRKGTTRMRLTAESIVDAEHRARDLGLRNPDSIVLEELDTQAVVRHYLEALSQIRRSEPA
jgi:hypothetical protein